MPAMLQGQPTQAGTAGDKLSRVESRPTLIPYYRLRPCAPGHKPYPSQAGDMDHQRSGQLFKDYILAPVVILQTFIIRGLIIARFESPHNRFGRRQSGYKRHLVDDGGPADGIFIRP